MQRINIIIKPKTHKPQNPDAATPKSQSQVFLDMAMIRAQENAANQAIALLYGHEAFELRVQGFGLRDAIFHYIVVISIV